MNTEHTGRSTPSPPHHPPAPLSPAQRQELSAQEEFESARLVAEGLSTNAPTATHYRDIVATPPTGDAVPYTQPGRPPMSQRATDHAALVLAYSLATLPLSAGSSLVLWSLSAVSPTVLTIAATAPPALILAVGLTARALGKAVREAAEGQPAHTTHHHHGPTHLTHTHVQVHAEARWFSRNINNP